MRPGAVLRLKPLDAPAKGESQDILQRAEKKRNHPEIEVAAVTSVRAPSGRLVALRFHTPDNP